MSSLRCHKNCYIQYNIDWVLADRIDSTSSEDDFGSPHSSWEFKRVFDQDRLCATFLVTTSVSSETGDRQLYFDRSNGLRCFRSLDDVPTSESQSFSKRKRKRTNLFWKMRYLQRGNSTNDDNSVDPRVLIPIYSTFASKSDVDSEYEVSALNAPKNIFVLVTDDTSAYRLLAASQIPPDHSSRLAVLEIGSSTGGTSEVLWQQIQKHPNSGRWLGFDTSAQMVTTVNDKLYATFPHLKESKAGQDQTSPWAMCHQIDPLMDPDAASVLARDHLGCESLPVVVIVFIDIGGNRDEGSVLRMVDWVLRTFQNDSFGPAETKNFQLHKIIIKSEEIHATFSNYVSSPPSMATCNGGGWLHSRLRVALRSSFPKHPLQAAKRFVPNSSQCGIGDSKIICRYYNYHKSGCAKKNDNMCPYDHNHCHMCLGLGHIAQDCPMIFESRSGKSKLTSF